jgi:UDP-N-acetylmuramoylalanine--D-glutamate ligase
VETMAEAVAEAKKLAQPGDVVLLSPASASFGRFKDYAERGELFIEEVKK